jgi:hypothetical protein
MEEKERRQIPDVSTRIPKAALSGETAQRYSPIIGSVSLIASAV